MDNFSYTELNETINWPSLKCFRVCPSFCTTPNRQRLRHFANIFAFHRRFESEVLGDDSSRILSTMDTRACGGYVLLFAFDPQVVLPLFFFGAPPVPVYDVFDQVNFILRDIRDRRFFDSKIKYFQKLINRIQIIRFYQRLTSFDVFEKFIFYYRFVNLNVWCVYMRIFL